MTTGTGGVRNLQVLLTANTGNLEQGLLRASNQVEHFARQTNKSSESMLNFGNVAKVGAAAGAAAVAVGLAYAVTKAAEFDKSMRNVNSLMQLSPQGFKKMEDQVISLSKTLPQSADVLAQGLYDITSSGFSGADAMLVLKSSAEAASAGLTTMANSAQAITAVLNAYGLKAKDAADVVLLEKDLGVLADGVVRYVGVKKRFGDDVEGQVHHLAVNVEYISVTPR